MKLSAHASFEGVEGPVLVVVMDGVGAGPGDEADAVARAHTPTLDTLRKSPLYCELAAHGTAVGLPSDGDMGNSEVGHNALGAGRVIDQGAKRVQLAVESGELFEGEVWKKLVARCDDEGGTLHFIGQLSDGNVHSHQAHLFAMLRRAASEGVERVRVHVLLDGRDVDERSALRYLDALDEVLEELSDRDYRVASGGGRMKVTMDRYEADWDMVARGWNAHVRGKAEYHVDSAQAAVKRFYDELDVSDQFMPAFVVDEGGAPVGTIEDGDAVVFFNFRGDRAIEISRAFTEDEFDAFDRGERPDVFYAGMMEYDGDAHIPPTYLVEPPAIDRTMGEYLAKSGVAQFACSETQKFGHVTYFWNGNRSGKFDEGLETYLEIPSDKVPFEERPWMKAAEITDATLIALMDGKAKALRINYANGDMVGHTGHYDAACIAVEAVDLQLARLLPMIEKTKGAIIITADHGNADQMYAKGKDGAYRKDDDGDYERMTSHTLRPVPFVIHAPGYELELATVKSPGLANVAATVLQLLGYEAPEHFEPSLLA